MNEPPKILQKIVDKVLFYRPKPKAKKVKEIKDGTPNRE